MTKKLDENQLALKEKFIRERGYWAEFWDYLLELNSDFFKAYLEFSSVPWRHGVLEPKVKELIYIAIDVATTHLYEPGTKVHMQNAIKYGATKEEIMEVFELTSVLGIHSCTVGVPILVDELREKGVEISEELTEKQKKLKEQFINERGYWSELWDQLLVLNDRYFEAYLNLSAVPWKKGTIDPKIKEFIYIAINASTTHLYEPGIRIHIKNALNLGATKDEIMEVFQLISVLGIHTCTEGVPLLVEELKKRGQG
ncbi:carboxymuconolactone decarboxylase family protein [Halalkalibacter krulwichiae]|uniref:Carboxymuconolactone decarboxylase family protein n=1 Tax=Halalkalibacter krulwichiae TaxID=199441 RepID=A0A1X9MH09_9BACI|nr:carboxymuconolactone decarboxylase family protein [Halalkalibacter krulwichiae]ARK29722.1 Carboxymuconolactone decarboxylase family protein [Halalkalibacter krulwichiae]